jgi:hypothetical protein
MSTQEDRTQEEIGRLTGEIQRLAAVASLHKTLLNDASEAALRLNVEPDVLARVLAANQMAIPGADDATTANVERLRQRIQRAASELAETRHALVAVRASWSWRLTAPLRGLVECSRFFVLLFRLDGRGFLNGKSMLGLVQWIAFHRLVRGSGLFDESYYAACIPTGSRGINPLLHFFVLGTKGGRNPNSLFDVGYYWQRNPDVARSSINPLVHYLKWGAYEGRDPHPQFDSSYYLERNADVRESRQNPLAHYLAPGIIEGRDPNAWFDTSEYLERNPDAAVLGFNPLTHYMEHNPHVLGCHPDL